jgi:hypothetical protein
VAGSANHSECAGDEVTTSKQQRRRGDKRTFCPVARDTANRTSPKEPAPSNTPILYPRRSAMAASGNEDAGRMRHDRSGSARGKEDVGTPRTTAPASSTRCWRYLTASLAESRPRARCPRSHAAADAGDGGATANSLQDDGDDRPS